MNTCIIPAVAIAATGLLAAQGNHVTARQIFFDEEETKPQQTKKEAVKKATATDQKRDGRRLRFPVRKGPLTSLPVMQRCPSPTPPIPLPSRNH